jgi:ferredoxin
MDTLFFHYFSATGNTERAVRRCADRLQNLGHTVNLVPITREALGRLPAAHHTAVHVICFPVLGFGPPDLVKRYIRRLSRTVIHETGLRAAVFATWGGHPFQAMEEARRMLRRRGFAILSSGGARYPFNWTQMISAAGEAEQAAELAAGDAMADAWAEWLDSQLLQDKAPLDRAAPPARLKAVGMFRVGPPGLAVSGLVQALFTSVGRRFLGSFFVADRRCTGCGLCAQRCPAATISLKSGRPSWGANCLGCNRCINICPVRSVQLSLPLFILQVGLNGAALMFIIQNIGRLVDLTGLPEPLHTLVAAGGAAALFALACLVQLWPFNRLLNLLGRRRFLVGFFGLSWTKGFRRYHAPATAAQNRP